MFSCLPSDAEQTSVIPRHRRCWASADSVSRLVTGYVWEVLHYGICRRYYVTAELVKPCTFLGHGMLRRMLALTDCLLHYLLFMAALRSRCGHYIFAL